MSNPIRERTADALRQERLDRFSVWLREELIRPALLFAETMGWDLIHEIAITLKGADGEPETKFLYGTMRISELRRWLDQEDAKSEGKKSP